MELQHEREHPNRGDERLQDDGGEGVRALVELAKALICHQDGLPSVHIEEQILTPAARCTSGERRELGRLCCVASMVLERTANAVLNMVAQYLAGVDDDGCLKGFSTSMEIIARALVDAYETSLLEAFRMGLQMELYCGRI